MGSHAADGLVEIPALNSAVTDLTQTLSAEEQAALNQKLTQFSQQAGSQIAILILPTTQPEQISQFGIRLADAWKIGREKQDDGVIVIVAKQDRKMRIEVGYGLEGAIPDAVAKRIIAEQLAPAFKQGRFYQGLNLATDNLIKLIQGEQLPPPSSGAQRTAQDGGVMHWLPILMFVAIFAGAILRGILGAFFGSAVTGGVLAVLAGWLGATLLVMGLVGLAAFIFTLAMGAGGQDGLPMGGFPGGYGGGRSGPDIFSGGGGGFGGGGASGDW